MALLELHGHFQLGFVGNDLDRATEMLGARYGISKFRRKRQNEYVETAHAYVGALMIEIISCAPGGWEAYDGYRPSEPEIVRLHHHGFLVKDDEKWRSVNDAAKAAGLKIFSASAFDGDLQVIYVDTRHDLGVFVEYVYLKDSALHYYDDIPRN